MAAAPDIYQKLDDSKHEIRLIRLESNDQDDDLIRVRIGVFSLDEQPNFVAVSYAWTTELPSNEIGVNGMPFFVRPNLHEFLKRLSDKTLEGWIFIDAICINQDDFGERAGQVQLMRRVYSEARMVVAWLGMPHELDESARQVSGMSISDATSLYLEWVDHARLHHRQAGHVLLGAWYSIFSREYWSRVWIVQEVLLARRLAVLFGNIMLSPSFVRSTIPDRFSRIRSSVVQQGENVVVYDLLLMELKRNIPDEVRHFARAYLVVDRLLQHIEKHDQNTTRSVYSMSFTEAVCLTVDQKSTRTLDRIFGTLGLTGSILEVDYTMSRLELLARGLVECALEFDLQQREGKSGEKTSHPSVEIIAITLSRTLRFKTMNILAHLICIVVLDMTLPQGSPHEDLYWTTWRILAKYLPALGNFPIPKIGLTRTRVRWYRSRNGKIRHTDYSMETKSYDEWLEWAREIARDQIDKRHLVRGMTE